ncbi:helicase-like transcription factor CHR28 [Senna tora]|uniref:Helicase-like transcription factor CHR28 n=1 Tax=Senna tora TaxID=362788 RepID=A0A834W3U6_9FABA|nr:helicase-like transcription factor CHR28 [Senna tora]
MLQKETRSLHCMGGILADDQGLGKTISMIALIQMQRSLQSKSKTDDNCNHKTEALNLDEDDDNGGDKVEKSKDNEESDDIKPTLESVSSTSTSTLVVCPASVLRQWARELDDKVGDEAKLSVLVYHGGTRTKDPVELAKYDVVLTTYSIVTNEVPKQPLVEEDEIDEKNVEKFGSRKSKKGKRGTDSSFDCASGPLARVGWFRVILDEAQTIKNHRTQVARACCSLRAKRRWCLSGTPIQNAIDDLYSYFRFLKYDPYAVYRSFYNTIKVPISKNSIQGYKKLQAVLRAIMLRRTKGTLIDGEPIISLPPKTIQLNKVDFSIEERAFYTKLEADSRTQFKAYAAAGTVNQNYANILLMLLRLRQACDHPLLVKDYSSDFVVQQSNYSSSKIRALLEILQLHCKLNNPSSGQVSSSGCFRNSQSSETSDHENSDPDVSVTRKTRKYSESTTEGPIKTIVFSQWTSMLDLIEDSLKDSGIQYRRLDGTMTLVARDKSVKDFNTDPEVTVMLMSLKAGNLGLNLVAACHVILLDLWWNPTTEDQAIDRAHRIGQTRPVTVTRLTVKDTVEDRILDLQEEKRKMVASAFGEDQAGGSAMRLTVDDLKYLFMV